MNGLAYLFADRFEPIRHHVTSDGMNPNHLSPNQMNVKAQKRITLTAEAISEKTKSVDLSSDTNFIEASVASEIVPVSVCVPSYG